MERPADDVIASLEEAERRRPRARGRRRAGSVRRSRTPWCATRCREQQSASRRARLHQRIGEALERAGTPAGCKPAELAYHFYASRHVGGAEQALALLRGGRGGRGASAGVRGRRGALPAGALGASTCARPTTRIGAARSCSRLGGVERRRGNPEARATFEDAADLARREGHPELLGRAALGFAGRYTEAGIIDGAAIDLLREALATLGDETASCARSSWPASRPRCSSPIRRPAPR